MQLLESNASLCVAVRDGLLQQTVTIHHVRTTVTRGLQAFRRLLDACRCTGRHWCPGHASWRPNTRRSAAADGSRDSLKRSLLLAPHPPRDLHEALVTYARRGILICVASLHVPTRTTRTVFRRTPCAHTGYRAAHALFVNG
jgi:hypothetical protein